MRTFLFLALALLLLAQFTVGQDSTFKCGTPEMDTTEFYNLPWFDLFMINMVIRIINFLSF